MSKLIILLIVLIIEGACTTIPKYDNTNWASIGVNESNSLYIYCTGESCTKASQLTAITAEDLKALEPDVAPIITNNMNTNIIKPRITSSNRKSKKYAKHSRIKKHNKITRVQKCYYVNSNGNLRGEE